MGQLNSGFWKEALLELLINNFSDITIKVAYPGKKCKSTASGNFTFRYPKKRKYKAAFSNLPNYENS